MFRTQQNAFDDAVAKATDENLTSENWEYILDVCDRVTAEESGAKDAVAAIIKRLSHRNANVQLYTLELANSLSQNCGQKIHRELASRSFTDALLRLASDRNTHQQVKSKILERMGEWTEMFSKDADLGIMEQAFSRLKSQNPNLHPPSKPMKQEITNADRQKEEDELQMALALSIKDKQPENKPANGQSAQTPQQQQQPVAAGPSQQTQPQPVVPGTTAATVSRVRALYDFQPTEDSELQFRKGDIIAVLESVYKDWWKGSLRGQTGIFPLNYVEKLADPTQEELQREAQMEAEVFGEIKNVEKLLTLLSTSNSDLNVRDNEEITELYHSTLAIRPKLIELIKKYSQRKDDFTQLNEKFIKARRDYESLLEASMSQSQYGRQHQQPYGYAGYSQQGPPPQQSPGRFYTPGPSVPEGTAPDPQPTPQPQQMPLPNGPQPFVYAGQAPPPQPQQQPPYPPGDARNRIPPTGQAPPTSNPYPHHRPTSTYDNPQELSSYASPTTEGQPPHAYPPHMQQAQQPGGPYSPSVYSPADGDVPQSYGQSAPAAPYGHPAQQQQQQPPYPSSAVPPPGPSYEQSPPPSHAIPHAASPPQSGGPSYPPPLNAGPPGGAYQAYKPQANPAYAGDPGSNPNDYYR